MVTEEKFLLADTGNMYFDALTAHTDQLKDMLADFKKTRRRCHFDGSAYKWMEDSVRNVINAVNAIMDDPRAKDGPLPAQTAEHIDRLYRQMRLAASAYLREHTNPSFPMGISRRTGALSIYRLYPVKLDESRVKVREVSIDGVAAKEPAKPAPKKPGLVQTIRNAKRKAAEAPEMRMGE